VPVAYLAQEYGVSKATFFKWRSKYIGAPVSDEKRLRETRNGNAKLKRMYTDLGVTSATLQLHVTCLGRHSPPRPVVVGRRLWCSAQRLGHGCCRRD